MQITKLFGLLIFSSLIFTSCTNDDDNTPLDITQAANKKPLGTSANDLLSNVNFNSLTIEMVSVKGFEPNVKAVEGFKTFLNERLLKPDGITINQRTVPSSKRAPFSLEEIIRIENETRTIFNTGDDITVYIYFADGSSINDSSNNITIGSSYLNTSIVIYEEAIRKLGNSLDSPAISTIETAVLNHEFAHLLGLVNNGTTVRSAHEDTDSKGHCNVANCLMAASMQFPSKMMEVLGNGVPVLDPKCIADLRANGGK